MKRKISSQEDTTANSADAHHQALLGDKSKNAVERSMAAVETARAEVQKSHPGESQENLDEAERNIRAYMEKAEAPNARFGDNEVRWAKEIAGSLEDLVRQVGQLVQEVVAEEAAARRRHLHPPKEKVKTAHTEYAFYAVVFL